MIVWDKISPHYHQKVSHLKTGKKILSKNQIDQQSHLHFWTKRNQLLFLSQSVCDVSSWQPEWVKTELSVLGKLLRNPGTESSDRMKLSEGQAGARACENFGAVSISASPLSVLLTMSSLTCQRPRYGWRNRTWFGARMLSFQCSQFCCWSPYWKGGWPCRCAASSQSHREQCVNHCPSHESWNQ